MRFRIKIPGGTIEERDSLGPANDSEPQVQIELRAAELESAVRSYDDVASIDESSGWVDHMHGEAAYQGGEAGWLARQIHDVRKTHALSDVGIDGWPRALIARLAATHDIDLPCTHDECTARGRGPLPEGWLADPETGDVLCPIHTATAAWLDVELDEDPIWLSLFAHEHPLGNASKPDGADRRIIEALNGDDDGSPTLASLTTALDVGGDQ